MANKQNKVFSVNAAKALAKTQVTEAEIKEKYGWADKIKFKTPDFSVYEKLLVLISSLGLLFIASLLNFGKFNLNVVLNSLAWPPVVAIVTLLGLTLAIAETIFEFTMVRGHINKPHIAEITVFKVVSLVLAGLVITMASAIAGVAVFGLLVYANYARTVTQRKKNFELYLEQKKQEIAANAALPVKQQQEISYCVASNSAGVVSPSEDVSEVITQA